MLEWWDSLYKRNKSSRFDVDGHGLKISLPSLFQSMTATECKRFLKRTRRKDASHKWMNNFMDLASVHNVWAVITDSVYLNPILINKTKQPNENKKKRRKKHDSDAFFTFKVGVAALIKFYVHILSMNIFCWSFLGLPMFFSPLFFLSPTWLWPSDKWRYYFHRIPFYRLFTRF